MTSDRDFYRTHSRWTDPGLFGPDLAAIPPEPTEIVRILSGVLLHPFIAPTRGIDVPVDAESDQTLRSAAAILDRALSRDARPLAASRAPRDRVFCICNGFARIATAVFRTHGRPARCRAGFATYFTPGFLEEHWVCEYWLDGSWRLLDAQLDDDFVAAAGLSFAPTDVPRDQFLDASTAWCRIRAGELDGDRLGLSPLGLAGAWMAFGEVMLDAAALNKEELLPWEKWSAGLDAIPGREPPAAWTGEVDEVARLLCGAPDGSLARRVYQERGWLRVPASVMSFLSGVPAEVVLAAPGR